MSQISAADSISLLSSQTVDLASAIGLGANVPANTPITSVAKVLCCVNFGIAVTAGAQGCVDNLGSMNLDIMSTSTKAKIATIVISHKTHFSLVGECKNSF